MRLSKRTVGSLVRRRFAGTILCVLGASVLPCFGAGMQSFQDAETLSSSSSSGVTISSTVKAGINSETNFGDSITCGIGAMPANQGYSSLLDTAIGKAAKNYCRPGDQAADLARVWVYPKTTPTLGSHQLYTVLIGTNDANSCGSSTGCIENWKQSLESSLAWLAMPSQDKTFPATATARTGTWTSDLTNGLKTTEKDASLTFTVKQTIAGRLMYVGYRIFDTTSTIHGAASLFVDGAEVKILSSAVTSGHSLSTNNGTKDTIVVASLPLGAVGKHTVKLVVTSQSGEEFSLQWLGVSSTNYRGNTAAPHVVVGSITRSGSSTLNGTIANYNSALSSLVSSLTSEGLHISIAPTSTALNTSTDLWDEFHPNNGGHLKVAKAFAGVL